MRHRQGSYEMPSTGDQPEPKRLRLANGQEVEIPRKLAPRATWESTKAPEYLVDFTGYADCPLCNGHAGEGGRLEGGLRMVHLTRDGSTGEYARACAACVYGAYRHVTGPKFRFWEDLSLASISPEVRITTAMTETDARAKLRELVRQIGVSPDLNREALMEARIVQMVETGHDGEIDGDTTWGPGVLAAKWERMKTRCRETAAEREAETAMAQDEELPF